jgi:hypothetical protein
MWDISSSSYLLACLDPAEAEWLDRHMPSICCTACLAMRLPISPPCQFNFRSSRQFGPDHLCGNYILSLLPHLTIFCPKSLLLADVLFCSSVFGLTLSVKERQHPFRPVSRRAQTSGSGGRASFCKPRFMGRAWDAQHTFRTFLKLWSKLPQTLRGDGDVGYERRHAHITT